MPFPFVEEPRLRERPALVIGTPPVTGGMAVVWVLMITSAANRGWTGDVSLERRHAECGLPVPCVIRTAKIATVSARQARRTGTLPSELFSEVCRELARILG